MYFPPIRIRLLCSAAVVASLWASSSVLADGERKQPTPQRIAALIEQLGADDYFQREQAQAELAAMSFEAFDALSAAENHPDIEVAARATYLVRLMRAEWPLASDPPEVKALLDDYELLDENERQQRMEGLARTPGEAGLAALCRLVRFERSQAMSKLAAITIFERTADEPSAWPRRDQVILESLGKSTRPAAEWLRTDVEAKHDPAAAIDAWAAHIDAEEARFRRAGSQSRPEIVTALLARQVELLEQAGRREEVGAVLAKMVALETGDSESLTKLMGWLTRHQAWTALDEVATRFTERVNADPILLYSLAEARQSQGRNDEAAAVVKQALALSPDNQSPHFYVGLQLRSRGLNDWAEQEFNQVLKIGPRNSIYALRVSPLLAEWHHDRLEEHEAAEMLRLTIEAMDQNSRQRNGGQNEGRDPVGLRARMNYFLAGEAEQKRDIAKQTELLDAAIALDPLEADVLIALYRLPSQDAARREKTLRQIDIAAEAFRREVEADPSQPTGYNQYAWLVGNTEGDKQRALRYSLKSLELSPDEPGYLDTLAHCYYGLGDYENAVKHQTKAVELDRHSQQMARALERFQKAAGK
ncbi:MAG: hypothetical protein HY000_02815 [Planctomycetes bacterium]|nr:hypothetical protein [Planctomycetota bacterium]